LRSLRDLIQPGCGVLPTVAGGAEPLAAIYPKEAHADFVTALGGEDFSLHAITKKLIQSEKLRAVRVSKEGEKLFRNVNEPGDLEDV
jgi:molybdopterin-guanine dinucleotide biosynthesis protein A